MQVISALKDKTEGLENSENKTGGVENSDNKTEGAENSVNKTEQRMENSDNNSFLLEDDPW